MSESEKKAKKVDWKMPVGENWIAVDQGNPKHIRMRVGPDMPSHIREAYRDAGVPDGAIIEFDP
jgi:hypothetical protein